MKKDPTRFNKSYFADAPNKMLHSNKATDITVAYVNYCIPLYNFLMKYLVILLLLSGCFKRSDYHKTVLPIDAQEQRK